ncbi:MAG TPA: iron-sulfur cluster assembly accessory protein [Balneolales bacterium]|nr:iron-sulfur cluster assembly accessory protein [Balneolales bacterium]
MAEQVQDFFFANTDTDPVVITDPAAHQLQKILKKQDNSEKYLRIGVKGGGCSGLSYVLDLDEKKNYDEEYEVKGVPFILDRRHRLYLEGTVIDFSEGLDNRGFTFENPNAASTCGCGSSFST